MATAELGINIVARNQAKGVLKGLQGDIKGIQSSLGGVMKIAAGNFISAAAIGSVRALNNAVRGVVGGLADASMAAADFNAQISSIGAVVGATTSELGDLKKLALDLGVDPNLKVSAVEAAQAIEMLARNGLKVPQIMEGAAKATVLLANATGADFSTAADIGTDAMAIFGIQAKDMAGAVDGITSVVNNSKFSIDDYGLALAQGGGVAASSGVSFKDYNTYLAGTAQYFKSGSDSGTAFKTMMTRLNPTTKEAAVLMEELGLITADGQNAFYDSTGALRDLNEIAGVMDQTFTGMTEQQRTNALVTLFGTDAYRAAYGMMKLGKDGYEDLQETMGNTSAIDSAAKRMDNLAGDMEIFRGVVESVKIQIGDEFQPALRTVFQSATSMLSDFTPAIIAFAGNVADALDRTVSRIVNVKTQFDFLASGGNIVGGILAGLGTATGAIVDVPIGAQVVSVDWGGIQASFDNATKDLSITLGDIVAGTFNLADYTTTSQIGDFFTGTISPKDLGLSMAIGDFFTGELSLKDKIAKVQIGDFFAGVEVGTGGKIAFTFNDTTLDIDFGALEQRIAGYIKAIPTGIYAAVGTMQSFDFTAIAETVSTSIKSLPTAIYTAIGGIGGIDLTALAERIAGTVKTLPTAIFSKLGADGAGIDFTTVATQIGTGIKTGVNLLFGETGVLTEVNNLVNGTLVDIGTKLESVDAAAISEGFNLAVSGILGVVTNVASTSFEGKSEQILALTTLSTSVIDFLNNFAASVDTTVIADGAAGIVKSFGSELEKTLSDPAIVDLGTSVGSFVSTIVAQIGNTLGDPNFGEDLGQGMGDALTGIAVGASNLATGLLNEFNSIDWNKFNDQVSGFLNNFITGLAASMAGQDFSPVAQAMLKALGNTAGVLVTGGTKETGLRNERIAIQEAVSGTTVEPTPPDWAADLMNWKPAPPDWLTELTIDIGATTLDIVSDLVIKPPAATEMAPLLTMNAPVLTTNFWPAYSPWEWPTIKTGLFEGWPSIPTSLFGGWPMIDPPTWGWPPVPYPWWLDSLVNIFNTGVKVNEPATGSGGGGGGSGGFDGNAIGTSNWRGGTTWVGETGPELVALPRGSRIYSNNDSMAMAGGGNVNVTVNVASVASNIDIEAMAYKVVQAIQRRR